ncbi:hypothetical protein ES705_41778 [subsurface metagenome]|jgi:hypothetical protein
MHVRVLFTAYFYRGDLMEPKYKLGQKVIIKPVKNQTLSARDSDIGQYAGQSGIVTDYYWLRPNMGEVFYIYTVKIGDDEKEIVLHEDEMEAD